MEIFAASKQWSERPADERFSSLEDLYNQTKQYADTAIERTANIVDLRTESYKGEVVLLGRQNAPAQLTHWSFGQLCSRIGAPASYLRELPSTLTVTNLNHGLKKLGDRKEGGAMQLLFHQNGSLLRADELRGLLCRALTSEKYTRIWNWEVAERLIQLQDLGWVPAESDFNLAKDSDLARERDLYASDHDMFVFLCHTDRVIAEPGNPEGLKRGIIVENSEVGASALKMTRFLYRGRCSNHIIWSASKVMEFNVRHIGQAKAKFSLYQYELKKYAESSASEEEAKIASAKSRVIADTKEGVLDKLFGIRKLGLTRKLIEAGYDAVKVEEDGEANTVWGMAQGLTRVSQNLPYADQRTEIDRAAGRLIELAEGSF